MTEKALCGNYMFIAGNHIETIICASSNSIMTADTCIRIGNFRFTVTVGTSSLKLTTTLESLVGACKALT